MPDPLPSTAKPSGILIVIVGPSGSGKDSLLKWVKTQLDGDENILFVKRIVTRVASAETEDHDSMNEAAFLAAKAAGGFAVTWQAHGLNYGLPLSAIAHVEGGGIAIANGARRALQDIVAAFPKVLIINITVDQDILRARLEGRGRETSAQIEARIAQASLALPEELPICNVDNSGPLEQAGAALLRLILAQRQDHECAAPLAQ